MNSYNVKVNSDTTINLEYNSGLISLGMKEPDSAPNYHRVNFKIVFSGTEYNIAEDVKSLDLESWIPAAFDNTLIIDSTDKESILGVRVIVAERRTLVYVGKLLMSMLQAKLDVVGNATTIDSVTFVELN
jgi:hypothetical protein